MQKYIKKPKTIKSVEKDQKKRSKYKFQIQKFINPFRIYNLVHGFLYVDNNNTTNEELDGFSLYNEITMVNSVRLVGLAKNYLIQNLHYI